MEFIKPELIYVLDKLTAFSLLVLFVIAIAKGWIVTRREHSQVERRCDAQQLTIDNLLAQNNQLLIGARVSAEVLKALPKAIGDGMSDV